MSAPAAIAARIAPAAMAWPPRWPTASMKALNWCRSSLGSGTKSSSVLVRCTEWRRVPSVPLSISTMTRPGTAKKPSAAMRIRAGKTVSVRLMPAERSSQVAKNSCTSSASALRPP